MAECGCEHEAQQLQERQNRTLVIILLINAAMFFIEAGADSRSVSCSRGFPRYAGDALVYGFSLYVIAQPRWKADRLGEGLASSVLDFRPRRHGAKLINPAIRSPPRSADRPSRAGRKYGVVLLCGIA
jgi:hypothetical protein